MKDIVQKTYTRFSQLRLKYKKVTVLNKLSIPYPFGVQYFLKDTLQTNYTLLGDFTEILSRVCSNRL